MKCHVNNFNKCYLLEKIAIITRKAKTNRDIVDSFMKHFTNDASDTTDQLVESWPYIPLLRNYDIYFVLDLCPSTCISVFLHVVFLLCTNANASEKRGWSNDETFYLLSFALRYCV